MTMIDVDTSPLQAAREWRGIGLVAAAMTAGLPVSQAEALEDGDPSAFGSIDEMIAAAVVYGSTIGIGRDEAMALLDRTVCRIGARVELPDHPAAGGVAGGDGFSEAVHERSARIAARDLVTSPPVEPPVETAAGARDLTDGDLVLEPIASAPSAPTVPVAAMPAIPEGPTPDQAVAASGEIDMEGAFRPDAPWERSLHSSELEAWVEDYEDAEPHDGVGMRRSGREPGALRARISSGAYGAIERVAGTDRADAAAQWASGTARRIGDLTRDGREQLRRSEHATLIVAIGGGAILIALVVALGGALGGPEAAGPEPADRSPVVATDAAPVGEQAPVEATTPAAKQPAKPKPMVAPARLTLDVYNAGSRKGYAREVAANLKAAGYGIGEVTNAKSRYPGATVIHPKDLAREAKVLARRTGISTLQVAPGSTRRITVVVA